MKENPHGDGLRWKIRPWAFEGSGADEGGRISRGKTGRRWPPLTTGHDYASPYLMSRKSPAPKLLLR